MMCSDISRIIKYLFILGTNKFYAGRRIRSLGCAPCTVPVLDYESEKDGRWRAINKRAGECGIHTQPLRKLQKDEV